MSAVDSPFQQRVADFMGSPVATIHPDASLQEAEQRLEQAPFSCLAVTDLDGHLCGVVSRSDVLRIGRLRATMADDSHLLRLPHHTVRAHMTRDVVTADPGMSLQAVATVMVQRHIHRVFIVENSRPVGVLSTRDLMRAIVAARVADPIKRWMSSPVMTVSATSTIGEATDLLQEARVRGLVVEDQEWPVGLFTQTEVLLAATREASTPVEEVMSCALLCLPQNMPLFRATALALETRARRILCTAAREIHGILSGLDMARVVATSPGP